MSGLGHHQGNLQPGYPPRPVESTSHSSDTMCSVSSSSGYPGFDRTGRVKTVPGEATPITAATPRAPLLANTRENQNQQVTSTEHYSGGLSERKKISGVFPKLSSIFKKVLNPASHISKLNLLLKSLFYFCYFKIYIFSTGFGSCWAILKNWKSKQIKFLDP